MIDSGAVFTGLLLCFSGAALALHCLSCLLAAAQCRRQGGKPAVTAGSAEEGISFLCPVGSGQSLAALERSLRSAFAVAYRKKEIIICLDAAEQDDTAKTALIRAVRQDYAEISSLLVTGAGDAGGGQDSLAKGWKAARYDRVMMMAPGIVLPPDCPARFLSLWQAGQHQAAGRPTGLVSAVLWGVGAQNGPARLEAAFLNSWQAQRLLLAGSLGRGVGQSSAQLWHYDIMSSGGGIKAFTRQAGEQAMAAAATQLVCRQGKKICLSARPLPWDLSPAAQPAFYDTRPAARCKLVAALLARQVQRLRFYRRFLPQFFYAETVLAVFLPFLALACACFGGAAPVWLPAAFLALWYGAEAGLILCLGRAAADKARQGGWQQAIMLLLRDIIFPFLWLFSLIRAF